MPQNRIDTSIVCPFFKETRRQSIVCEGLYSTGTSAAFTFSFPSLRRDYQKAFCAACYERCVWAKVMLEKYGGI